MALSLAATAEAQVGGRVGLIRDHLPPGGSLLGSLGVDVDGAGDVNGDGFDDIIAACYGLDAAVVYSGKDGSTLHWFTRVGSSSVYGSEVAGVGDINGDGFADVAVGDRGDARVYLHSGMDGSLLHTLSGPPVYSDFGCSIAGLEDVTGDGIPDILVGARSTSVPPHNFCGSAFVFSGASGTQVLRVDGDISYASFGRHVNDAGDVNGDGTPDFLVVASRDTQPLGTLGATIVYSGVDGSQLLRATGENGQSGIWMRADGIGDVDGDGLDDIAVGDHSTGLPWDRRGVVTVYSGASGLALWEWAGVGDQKIGMDVAGTGDINGDGIPDLLVGIQGDYGGSLSRPRRSAMLVAGHNGKFLARLSDSDGDSSIRFGEAVAAVGDINGDGRTEFAVGDDEHGISKGRVLVFGFNPQMTASTTEVSASLGGTVDLNIDFPQVDAGQSYAVLASRRGTGPFQGAGIRIPLTPDQVFRNAAGGQYPFANHTGMHGLLDPDGDATAQIVFQPLEVPGWMVGKTFYLAAVTADASGVSEKSSIVVGIRFLP
ncbi:MAG: VCBS repeat-containing protein [Planctomycetota bacterium]